MTNTSTTQWEAPLGDPTTQAKLLAIASSSARVVSLVRSQSAEQESFAVCTDANLHRPDLAHLPHLVVLDVDSTLIDQEVIDLLADFAGVGHEVAQITEQAMQGNLDFETALRERVALLANTSAEALGLASSTITLRQGAAELVSTLQQVGCQVGLVSGGFIQVIGPLAKALGIHLIAANQLEVTNQVITGTLTGPIVDRVGKSDALQRFTSTLQIPLSQTVAIGDGANDIEMLKTAGFGVAFNAKPALIAAADATVISPYLSDCLYVLGFSIRG